MESWILTLLTFIPLLGAAVILSLPGKAISLIRWVAMAATGICLVLAGWLYMAFDRSVAGMQFMVKAPWIPSFDINYSMGIDGLSVSMVLLTALLGFLCIPASWGIQKGVKGYFALFLLLEAGMQGVFVSTDFFLFYVFWEIMLLPMYFLIGIWGGPRKEYDGSGHGQTHLRYACDDGSGESFRVAPIGRGLRPIGLDRGLDGDVRRIRNQGAPVSVPYLATRRARRGTHRNQRHSGRCAPQNGHLRDPSFQLPDVA